MKVAAREQGWFANLRRDRLLFALAAAVLLVFQLLQPVAYAGPARQTICAANAGSAPLDTGHHDGADGCSDCASCCPSGIADVPRATVLSALRCEFPARAGRAVLDPSGPPPPASRRPHAIRAPPFSV